MNGARATEESNYTQCIEDIVSIDPSSQTDVALLWFDSNGAASCSDWKRKKSIEDELRVKVSIWLYHLDKLEIVARRREHMDGVRAELLNANTDYRLWKSIPENIISKNSFDKRLTMIQNKIFDVSEFSGAKRAAIRATA